MIMPDTVLSFDGAGFPLVLDLVRKHDVDTVSGNPWHDTETGKFADAPPGVKLLRGADLMKRSSSATKQKIDHFVQQHAPIEVMAADALPDGRIAVTFVRGTDRLGTMYFSEEEWGDEGGEKAKDGEEPAEQGSGQPAERDTTQAPAQPELEERVKSLEEKWAEQEAQLERARRQIEEFEAERAQREQEADQAYRDETAPEFAGAEEVPSRLRGDAVERLAPEMNTEQLETTAERLAGFGNKERMAEVMDAHGDRTIAEMASPADVAEGLETMREIEPQRTGARRRNVPEPPPQPELDPPPPADSDDDSRAPMLFNQADLKDVPKFVEDDDYVFQQKIDGIRGQLVIRPGEEPWFRSSNGTPLKSSTARLITVPLLDQLPDLGAGDMEYSVDGELLNGKFHVFDFIVAGHEDMPFEERMKLAERWVELMGLDMIAAVPVARTKEEKQRLYDAVYANGGEGVMMKRKDSPYNYDGRVSHTLKAKFRSTAEVVVLEKNRGGTKNYIIGMYVDGKMTEVGSTSAIGKPNAEVGDVIEVAYLWAHPATNALTQPSMVRTRPDKVHADANAEKLRFVNKEVLDASVLGEGGDTEQSTGPEFAEGAVVDTGAGTYRVKQIRSDGSWRGADTETGEERSFKPFDESWGKVVEAAPPPHVSPLDEQDVTITEEQRESIVKHVQESYDTNRRLRLKAKDPETDEWHDHLQKRVDDVNDAVDANSTNAQVTAWRAVDGYPIEKFVADFGLEEGSVIRDPALVSATTDEKWADDYLAEGEEWNGEGFKMVLDVPEGTQAVYIPAAMKNKQAELLFGTDHPMRVTKIDLENRELHLEVVPQRSGDGEPVTQGAGKESWQDSGVDRRPFGEHTLYHSSRVDERESILASGLDPSFDRMGGDARIYYDTVDPGDSEHWDTWAVDARTIKTERDIDPENPGSWLMSGDVAKPVLIGRGGPKPSGSTGGEEEGQIEEPITEPGGDQQDEPEAPQGAGGDQVEEPIPLDLPKRVTQRWLDEAIPRLSDEDFERLQSHLRGKNWTEQELATRVRPLRPGYSPGPAVVEDEQGTTPQDVADAFEEIRDAGNPALGTAALDPPKRITQNWLAKVVPAMSADDFNELVRLLRSKNWTQEELDTRVHPLRKAEAPAPRPPKPEPPKPQPPEPLGPDVADMDIPDLFDEMRNLEHAIAQNRFKSTDAQQSRLRELRGELQRRGYNPYGAPPSPKPAPKQKLEGAVSITDLFNDDRFKKLYKRENGRQVAVINLDPEDFEEEFEVYDESGAIVGKYAGWDNDAEAFLFEFNMDSDPGAKKFESWQMFEGEEIGDTGWKVGDRFEAELSLVDQKAGFSDRGVVIGLAEPKPHMSDPDNVVQVKFDDGRVKTYHVNNITREMSDVAGMLDEMLGASAVDRLMRALFENEKESVSKHGASRKYDSWDGSYRPVPGHTAGRDKAIEEFGHALFEAFGIEEHSWNGQFRHNADMPKGTVAWALWEGRIEYRTEMGDRLDRLARAMATGSRPAPDEVEALRTVIHELVHASLRTKARRKLRTQYGNGNAAATFVEEGMTEAIARSWTAQLLEAWGRDPDELEHLQSEWSYPKETKWVRRYNMDNRIPQSARQYSDEWRAERRRLRAEAAYDLWRIQASIGDVTARLNAMKRLAKQKQGEGNTQRWVLGDVPSQGHGKITGEYAPGQIVQTPQGEGRIERVVDGVLWIRLETGRLTTMAESVVREYAQGGS